MGRLALGPEMTIFFNFSPFVDQNGQNSQEITLLREKYYEN